ELILGHAGTRDVCRPSVGRHMTDPMPGQGVVVDREFPCRSLDRRAGGEQPLDPHPFGVVASPTASCPRTLFSRHRLSPMIFFKNSWAAMVPLPQGRPQTNSASLRRGHGGTS